MWCVLRILSRSAFSMSRLQGCYARAGLFHCMQTGSSGFRFQDAVRHGHAVFMAQGEMCPQAACFHPLGTPAGKVIGRCPAGQADGFDLAEGEGLPQTGARRRYIEDEPKRNRIVNYESSNDAYVVEDYDCVALVENIVMGPNPAPGA